MTNIDYMNYWIESSDEDYDTMKVLYNNKKYSWSLFIGHLVIEKLLKGIYAKDNVNDFIAPKIHNLVLLAKKCNLEFSSELKEKIGIINTFNIAARYDDHKKAFQNKCTEKYTTEQIGIIEEVREWLKNQLV